MKQDSFLLRRFCIFLPPKSTGKEQTFALFESLWAQLQQRGAANKKQRDSLTARFDDLAYTSCDSKTDVHDFVTQQECFSANNKLRRHH